MTSAIQKPEDLDLQRESLVRTIDRLKTELHQTREALHELNRREQKRDYNQATTGAAAGPAESASLGMNHQALSSRGREANAIYFVTIGGGSLYFSSSFCSSAFRCVFMNLVLFGRRGCARRG